MNLLHKVLPDIPWIACTGQARQFPRHVIPHPYAGGKIICVTHKPAVLVVISGSSFTCTRHITKRKAAPRPGLDNGNQHVCHHTRSIRFVYFLFFALGLQNHIFLGVRNLHNAGWFPEFSIIFQCRIGRGHLHGRHAVRKSAQCARGTHILLIQPGKFHFFQIRKAHLRRQFLQHIPGYRIFRSLHRIAQGNIALIAASGVCRPFFRLHIFHHRIGRVTTLQRRCIDNQGFDRASRLAETLIRTV